MAAPSTLRTMVEDMINSPFISGSVSSITTSIKKLKYLQQFNVISDNYFAQQCSIISDALEELYNVNVETLNLQDNTKVQSLADDKSWDDNIYRVKTTLQQALEEILQVVNAAYMNNEEVSIRCINTQELIRARLRSYNGKPYALDIVDCKDNLYTITDTQIIQEIVKGRKVMFDNTYGFVTILAPELIDYGTLLYDLAHNSKSSYKKYVNFITYSDLLNMSYDASYDNVDIYTVEETTEWLRTTGIESLSTHNNLAVYIETQAADVEEKQSRIIVIGRAISNIELYVTKTQIVLDKFSNNLLQKVFVHTVNGVNGEVLIPHSLDDDELEVGSCLTLPYDSITVTLQTK